MRKNEDCESLSTLALEQRIKQMSMVQKFPSDCELINKKFHIADIMVIDPINPSKPPEQK